MEHHHHHRPPKEDSTISDVNSSIYKVAEAHVQSYANAVKLGSKDIKIPQIAAALHSHYGSTFTAFTLGHVATIPAGSEGEKGIASHLERFDKSGLGLDIEMVKLRVEVVAPHAAACWVTWRIRPRKEGVAAWEWTNLYGFRRSQGQEKGFWEYVVCDQEISGLVERAPDFFEL